MFRVFLLLFLCSVQFFPLWGGFYPYQYLKKLSYDVYFVSNQNLITYKKGNITLQLQLGQKLFLINSHTYRFEKELVRGPKGHMLSYRDGQIFMQFLKHYEKNVAPLLEKSLEKQKKVDKIVQNEKEKVKDSEDSKETKDMPDAIAPKDDVTKKPSVVFLKSEEDIPKGIWEKAAYKGEIVSPLHFFDKEIDTIIIDPGHGGIDPGAIRHGYQEKDLTLMCSQELYQILKEEIKKRSIRASNGKLVRVVRTRSSDKSVSLESRTHLANKALPEKSNGVFISLHFNAWLNEQPRGMEIYYLGQNLDYYQKKHDNEKPLRWEKSKNLERIFTFLEVIQFQKESFLMAQVLQKNMMETDIGYPSDRGIRTDMFYVLRGVLMPSLLIELGFLSNKKDMNYFNHPAKRRKLLKVIANSIFDYIKIYKKTRGFTEKTIKF